MVAQRTELPSSVRTCALGGPGLTAVSRCLGLPNGVRTVLALTVEPRDSRVRGRPCDKPAIL